MPYAASQAPPKYSIQVLDRRLDYVAVVTLIHSLAALALLPATLLDEILLLVVIRSVGTVIVPNIS